MDLESITLDVDQHIDINAPVAEVFEGLLHQLAEGNTAPGDKPMPMCLERRPGGRWYRDLGNDAGHLWGFVQVIKPPTLLEIHGPMFMSYPVASHLALKLKETPEGTRLSLRHRALGFLEQEHCQGATQGWSHYLNKVKQHCE